jgi:hypothetical protein
MIVRSGFVLEALREGPEFTLYRGWQQDNPLPVLAVALAAERPWPQSLARRKPLPDAGANVGSHRKPDV